MSSPAVWKMGFFFRLPELVEFARNSINLRLQAVVQLELIRRNNTSRFVHLGLIASPVDLGHLQSQSPPTGGINYDILRVGGLEVSSVDGDVQMSDELQFSKLYRVARDL